VTNRFWGLLVLACMGVGALVWVVVYFNKSAHLELTGAILKVRAQSTDPTNTMVVADFRITNTSGRPFVVNAVSVNMDVPDGSTPVESKILSRSTVDQLFQYFGQLRPKYNDVLTLQDRIEPGQTVDRMVAASFDVPPSVVESRRTLRVRIEEFDGVVAEIIENR